MRGTILRKLLVENIRSHPSSSVEFGEGLNCIVGGVGKGKTSLLLALHFALYGQPLIGKTYDYLLRDGAPQAKISLEFEQSNRSFRIIRGLRREGGRIGQDPNGLYLHEGGKALAWGKASAIDEQLQTIIGLDDNVFKQFIWIQQDKLKDLLLTRPGDRQRIIDEALGLSDFEGAREGLGEWERSYKEEVGRLRTDPDVTSLEDTRKDSTALASEITTLQVELEMKRLDLKEAEKRLEAVKGEKDRWEADRRKVEGLRLQRAGLVKERDMAVRHLEEAGGRLGQLEEERRHLGETIAQAGVRIDRIIEQMRGMGFVEIKKPDDLDPLGREVDEEISAKNRELGQAQANISNLQKSLDAIQTQSLCPTCRRELDAVYRDELIAHLTQDKTENQLKIQVLGEEIENRSFHRCLIDEAIENIVHAENQRETARSQREEKEREIEKTKNAIAEGEMSRATVEGQIEKLEGEIAQFPQDNLDLEREWEKRIEELKNLSATLKTNTRIIEEKGKRQELLGEKLGRGLEKERRGRRVEAILRNIAVFRGVYREVVPQLRRSYIEGLKEAVQSILDALTIDSQRNLSVEIDDGYTPTLKEAPSPPRDIAFVSGGEKTWVALAYRIGLGEIVTEAKTGQSLETLILDEPTESLGVEDGSIEALASTLGNLRMIRQIIIVTHSEELAEKADRKIVLRRVDDVSQVEEVKN